MMDMNELRQTQLSYYFLDAVTAYMDFEKTTHFLRTKDGKQIYYAEIHTVSAIKENEGIHITALAEKLGVTLGAVSQILIKLEKKGLIKKERDPRNQSRFLLTLTCEGEIAHLNHLRFHEAFDDLVYSVLEGKSEEQVRFLKQCLIDLAAKLQTATEEEKKKQK
ncbi:hypothetical protein X546_04670 [Brevibacillus borstelensis cifa_chp40]|nr:hypothetical protein X546_04670 [Brevibacillus borstelensis cifa_chp40]